MAAREALQRFRQIGRHVAHTLFPEDFEMYFVALELVNSRGETVEYFAFPLTPQSVNIREPQIQSIQQTAGGTTVISSDVFMPIEIGLQGNFGQKFKFLNSRNLSIFSALANNGDQFFQRRSFNDAVKTGYGCTQIMRRIVRKSSRLDEYDRPHSLYLYNLIMGSSFLVRVNGEPNFRMDMQNNMIWSYNINFTALLPYEQMKIESRRSNIKLFTSYAVQNTINQNLNSVRSIL